MKDLTDLLEMLGLPPEAIVAIILATSMFIFFLKHFLDRREKRETTRLEDLRKYARLQEEALLKAYRMLYEQVDLNTLSQKEFSQVICRADELIMEPFTRYRSDLPDGVSVVGVDYGQQRQCKSSRIGWHEQGDEAGDGL